MKRVLIGLLCLVNAICWSDPEQDTYKIFCAEVEELAPGFTAANGNPLNNVHGDPEWSSFLDRPYINSYTRRDWLAKYGNHTESTAQMFKKFQSQQFEKLLANDADFFQREGYEILEPEVSAFGDPLEKEPRFSGTPVEKPLIKKSGMEIIILLLVVFSIFSSLFFLRRIKAPMPRLRYLKYSVLAIVGIYGTYELFINSVVGVVMGEGAVSVVLSLIFGAIFWASAGLKFAVMIRRLQDIRASTWWLLLGPFPPFQIALYFWPSKRTDEKIPLTPPLYKE